jgi:hypothetical protein
MTLGIVFTLLVIALVGRGVLLRARHGEPMQRYAVIWAAVLVLLFAGAWVVDRHSASGTFFT